MISVVEKWRPVKGYEGLYEVSDWGDVKSIRSGKIMKPNSITRGYLQLTLVKEGKRKGLLVHRIVAQAFIPNTDNLPQINHKDENHKNNRVDNLEWCTNEYNHNYGTHNERVAIANINNPKRSVRINQYTLEGEFVREWESMGEAQRNGFSAGHICMCCKGQRAYHKDFVWKYAEE